MPHDTATAPAMLGIMLGTMRLKLIRHLWGVDQSWEQCFPKIRAEGFTGIETVLIPPAEEARFQSLMSASQFDYIAMAFTSGEGVSAHVKSFQQQLDRAVALRARQLTVHSGSDAWSDEEATSFYREIVAIERSAKIPCAHETHRGRVFFN